MKRIVFHAKKLFSIQLMLFVLLGIHQIKAEPVIVDGINPEFHGVYYLEGFSTDSGKTYTDLKTMPEQDKKELYIYINKDSIKFMGFLFIVESVKEIILPNNIRQQLVQISNDKQVFIIAQTQGYLCVQIYSDMQLAETGRYFFKLIQ